VKLWLRGARQIDTFEKGIRRVSSTFSKALLVNHCQKAARVNLNVNKWEKNILQLKVGGNTLKHVWLLKPKIWLEFRRRQTSRILTRRRDPSLCLGAAHQHVNAAHGAVHIGVCF
jgi:hypothetical protein